MINSLLFLLVFGLFMGPAEYYLHDPFSENLFYGSDFHAIFFFAVGDTRVTHHLYTHLHVHMYK